MFLLFYVLVVGAAISRPQIVVGAAISRPQRSSREALRPIENAQKPRCFRRQK